MCLDESLFKDIATAFVSSPMAQKAKACPSVNELAEFYRTGSCAYRGDLSQTLLEGLHYQNYQIQEWRDYLFLLSCSTSDEVALQYALHHLPKRAFVLDYAPPCDSGLYKNADAMIKELRDLRLSFVYRNRDEEYFIWFAMLPHYLLGVSELQSTGRFAYGMKYIANPWYEERGATLADPPNLEEAQRGLISRTGVSRRM
jgi:hypothetical protein